MLAILIRMMMMNDFYIGGHHIVRNDGKLSLHSECTQSLAPKTHITRTGIKGAVVRLSPAKKMR